MKLGCGQCHPDLKLTADPTCGDAACHKDPKIEYPTRRPGPIVTMRLPAPGRTRLSAAAGRPRGVIE
jgi:hypothetical protein